MTIHTPSLQRSNHRPPPFPLQGTSFPRRTARPEPHGFCMNRGDLRFPEEGAASTSVLGPWVPGGARLRGPSLLLEAGPRMTSLPFQTQLLIVVKG